MKNEEKILEVVLDLKENITHLTDRVDWIEENMFTKADQDKMMVILNRLDTDRLAQVSRTDRIEARVDGHDQVIGQLKTQLKIA